MDAYSDTDASLRDVRREIDAIDLQLLEQLQKRFALIERVLQAKAASRDQPVAAMRPAREAQILRHLLKVNRGAVPERLLVRLWREIISRATLQQVDLRVHATRSALGSDAAQLMVRDQFCEIPVTRHARIDDVLAAVAASLEDLAVVAIDEAWPAACLAGAAGKARIIAALPGCSECPEPDMFVVGHSDWVASGDDETLVLTKRSLPADVSPEPVWRRTTADGLHLAALPGFLQDNDLGLSALAKNEDLALQVLGRYPSRLTLTG